MTTTHEGGLWLANAEELTALECSTLMGGGFWCDVGNWIGDVDDWFGRFVESLDRQLTGTNYYAEIGIPDAGSIADGMLGLIAESGTPNWTSLQDFVDSVLDVYVVGVGIETLEFWGGAVGTAAADATYSPPGG